MEKAKQYLATGLSGLKISPKRNIRFMDVTVNLIAGIGLVSALLLYTVPQSGRYLDALIWLFIGR